MIHLSRSSRYFRVNQVFLCAAGCASDFYFNSVLALNLILVHPFDQRTSSFAVSRLITNERFWTLRKDARQQETISRERLSSWKHCRRILKIEMSRLFISAMNHGHINVVDNKLAIALTQIADSCFVVQTERSLKLQIVAEKLKDSQSTAGDCNGVELWLIIVIAS